MEKFREQLFNESGIEQILNFMGTYPKDYYHQLRQSEEIVLLVGFPNSGKREFLYELSKTKVKINFLVHDLITNYSENVLKKLAHVLSLTKLLNQAKRIKIVIFVYCANNSEIKHDVRQLLKKITYLVKRVPFYKASIGLLYKNDLEAVQGFKLDFSSQYQYLVEGNRKCMAKVINELKVNANINRDLTNMLLEQDDKGAYPKIDKLIIHNRMNIGRMYGSETILDVEQLEYFVKHTLKFVEINPDDFRINSFRTTEAVFTKFMGHIELKTQSFVESIFKHVIPENSTNLPTMKRELDLFVNITKQLEYNTTDLAPHNLLKSLLANNVTTKGIEEANTNYLNLHHAYFNARQVLSNKREQFTASNIVDVFDDKLHGLSASFENCKVKNEIILGLKDFHEEIDILQEVEYTDIEEKYYDLLPVNKIFQKAIQIKATDVASRIEQTVKDRVYEDVKDKIRNIFLEFSRKIETPNLQNHQVIQELATIKERMDHMIPLKYSFFWKVPLAKWNVVNNTTFDGEWLEQLTENELLLKQIQRHLDYNMYGKDLSDKNYHSGLLILSSNTLLGQDKPEPSTYQYEVNKLYDELKQNVSAKSLQSLTASSKQIVDEIVKHLGKNISTVFSARLFNEQTKSTKDEIDQHKLHLKKLQNYKKTFDKFFKNLENYFELNYIPTPPLQWNELIAVKQDFINVQAMIGEKMFDKAETEEYWGLNFVYAREILESKSGASSIASIINRAVKWVTNKTSFLFQAPNFSLVHSNVIPKFPSSSLQRTLPNDCQQIEVNSSLLLLDLIMRKITNKKPQRFVENRNSRFLAQAHALNIVAECEEKLTRLVGDDEVLSYDFSMMQQKLFERISKLDNMHAIESIKAEALELIGFEIQKR